MGISLWAGDSLLLFDNLLASNDAICTPGCICQSAVSQRGYSGVCHKAAGLNKTPDDPDRRLNLRPIVRCHRLPFFDL